MKMLGDGPFWSSHIQKTVRTTTTLFEYWTEIFLRSSVVVGYKITHLDTFHQLPFHIQFYIHIHRIQKSFHNLLMPLNHGVPPVLGYKITHLDTFHQLTFHIQFYTHIHRIQKSSYNLLKFHRYQLYYIHQYL
jgi:hypothetical protein